MLLPPSRCFILLPSKCCLSDGFRFKDSKIESTFFSGISIPRILFSFSVLTFTFQGLKSDFLISYKLLAISPPAISKIKSTHLLSASIVPPAFTPLSKILLASDLKPSA